MLMHFLSFPDQSMNLNLKVTCASTSKMHHPRQNTMPPQSHKNTQIFKLPVSLLHSNSTWRWGTSSPFIIKTGFNWPLVLVVVPSGFQRDNLATPHKVLRKFTDVFIMNTTDHEWKAQRKHLTCLNNFCLWTERAALPYTGIKVCRIPFLSNRPLYRPPMEVTRTFINRTRACDQCREWSSGNLHFKWYGSLLKYLPVDGLEQRTDYELVSSLCNIHHRIVMMEVSAK